MSPKGKAQPKAASVKKGATKQAGGNQLQGLKACQMAVNFRNLMKYRSSEKCVKAWGIQQKFLSTEPTMGPKAWGHKSHLILGSPLSWVFFIYIGPELRLPVP